MKKIILLTTFIMLFSNFIYAQNTIIKDYKYVARFDTDKAELNQHAKSTLEKRLADFTQLDIQSIEIIGHTDNRGSLEYNEDLSLRRAKTVQQFLEQNGLGNYPIRISFQGETAPQIMDNSETALTMNRRVEIWFYTKEIIPKNEFVEISRTTTIDKIIPNEYVAKTHEPKELTNYQKFHQQLDKEFQSFSFDNNDNGIIQANEGTIILFSPNSFCDCQTKKELEGKIDIQLKEYYSISDFLKAGLNTSANNKTLQSAGTIYIKAFQNKKEVCLKNRQDYQILFPKNKMNEDNYNDMNLFVGNLDEEGEVNWGVMAKNRLMNSNTVNYNDLNRSRRRILICLTGECKLKFFKRCSMFFANHEGWKRYKYGRSPIGKKESNRLAQIERERINKRNNLIQNFEGNFEELVEGLKELGETEDFIFDYYITNSNQMDFINCDRFFKTPINELQTVFVPVDYSDKVSVKLILESENAIVRGWNSDSENTYSFGNLPKGEKVTIIAYDYTKQGTPKLAKKTFNIGEVISLQASDFNTYSLANFQKQLSNLN